MGLSKTDAEAAEDDGMEEEKCVSEETLLALKRAMEGRQEKSSEAKAIDAAAKEDDGREKSRARAIFDEHFAASVFGECVFLVGRGVPREADSAIKSRGGAVVFSASELSKLKYAERKLLYLGDSGER